MAFTSKTTIFTNQRNLFDIVVIFASEAWPICLHFWFSIVALMVYFYLKLLCDRSFGFLTCDLLLRKVLIHWGKEMWLLWLSHARSLYLLACLSFISFCLVWFVLERWLLLCRCQSCSCAYQGLLLLFNIGLHQTFDIWMNVHNCWWHAIQESDLVSDERIHFVTAMLIENCFLMLNDNERTKYC